MKCALTGPPIAAHFFVCNTYYGSSRPAVVADPQTHATVRGMNQLQIQLYPRRDGKIGYQLVHLPTRKIKARSRSYSRIRAYRDVLAVRLRACAR